MTGTKLELTWPGKNKVFELEPRILIEKPELSYWDPNTENMIIHWDNLLALKALEQQFTWKIKCIYIDPPYNTWSAFEYYDDWLEHTIRLNLMRSRLTILKQLLKEDGCIAVQIWFDEMAYLKVLMDEVFWRDNCFGQVAVRMSHSAWMKRKAADKRMIKNTEYILFYFKNISPEIKPIYEVTDEYPVNYYQYVDIFPKWNNKWKYINLVDVLWNNFKDEFERFWLKKNNKSIKPLFATSEKVKEFIFINKNKILRKDSNAPKIDNLWDVTFADNEFIEYDSNWDSYYIWLNSNWNYYQLYSLDDKVKTIESIDEEWNIVKKDAITNLVWDWRDNFYKDMSRVDIEWGVKMKTSKKPERLLYWIINSLTNNNDIVLDSFLWSWTTTAVAHKMWRKWIWIELWDHCYSLSKVRMDNVIDWDITGISKIMNWQWWGWYKFYELWPSVLLQDKYWNYIINPNFNSSELVQAICKIENFTYKAYEDNIKHWYSTEKDFIHVTTRHITQEIIKDIQETSLKDWETMLIVAKTFESNLDLPDNIQIKKIPTEILDKCEYNKDNYSLPISQEEITDED